MEIKGKVAIVTGGAKGLGLTYVHKLLDKGAKVAIFDILPTGVKTAESLNKSHRHTRCIFVRGDVTNKEDIQRCFDEVSRTFGKPHILVNNAGLADKDYSRMMQVNVLGLMTCTEMALEIMHEDKGGEGGVIINMGSIAGLEVFPGNPGYFASKHAVVGYTKALCMMYNSECTGVRVNCLCPGFIKTDLTHNLEVLFDEKPVAAEAFERHGGWTPPEVVGNALLRLCVDDALHGVVLVSNAIKEEIVYPEDLRDTKIL